MVVVTEQRRPFDTDRAIAKRRPFRRTGNDSNVTAHPSILQAASSSESFARIRGQRAGGHSHLFPPRRLPRSRHPAYLQNSPCLVTHLFSQLELLRRLYS